MSGKETFKAIAMALALSSVEAFLAILVLLAGVPILFAPEHLSPGSLLRTLPMFMVYGWAIGMVVGGILTLVGIGFRSYHVERAGVAQLAGVAFVYGLAMIASAGFTAAFLPSLTYLLFGVAMVARYYVLGRVLKGVSLARDFSRGKK